MKIATKIVIASTLLCSVAAKATVHLSDGERDLIRTSFISESDEPIDSIRENKKSEIENYFQQIRGQMVTVANSIGVRDAMVAFSDTFERYPVEFVSSSDISQLQVTIRRVSVRHIVELMVVNRPMSKMFCRVYLTKRKPYRRGILVSIRTP